jgi:hypothetical protein
VQAVIDVGIDGDGEFLGHSGASNTYRYTSRARERNA